MNQWNRRRSAITYQWKIQQSRLFFVYSAHNCTVSILADNKCSFIYLFIIYLYESDHLHNKRVVGIHLWWCWCRHIWKYLTTSIKRGSLWSTYDDVGAATFGSAWPPPQQGGCLRYTYGDVGVVIFVHMYLTTSMTRGLLGSTRRKAVMLVPPYLKSSRSTRCKSCKQPVTALKIFLNSNRQNLSNVSIFM
jgi:hypothetical protein